MCPKDADGMANIVDPDQTAPLEQSDQGCSVCSDLSVPIFRNFMVYYYCCLGTSITQRLCIWMLMVSENLDPFVYYNDL